MVIAVLGVIIFTGIAVLHKSKNKPATSEVTWSFNEQQLKWFARTGTAPMCKDPFVFDKTPVNMADVSSVLMPGTYRGYSYKPHGGFGVPNTEGNTTVYMPADATLVGMTRYYEGSSPDLQYVLTFETDCGIAFRFDHLYTLSPELQTLAEKTPSPKLNDTRSNPNVRFPRTKLKSGQVIATQVGLPSSKLYGFDFGVYDYRKQNTISKNPKWAAIHNQYQSLEWFGVCWFDMLPKDDAVIAKQLSLKQIDTRRTVQITSDYCSNAPYKTLDINDGKPTDG